MRIAIVLAACIAPLLASVGVPAAASAQEWREDPCHVQRHDAARTGAIVGGLVGALVGSQMTRNHAAGAIIGGGVGAAAGHHIGAHSVACRAYPVGYSHHPGCHWVVDSYHGGTRSYEVCRGPDGYWRPYGSS